MPAVGENDTMRSRAIAVLKTPGGTLLLLRDFLGITFTFAGLEKLSNPDFFKTSAPASFAAQVRGAILTSPLHGALRPALHAPVLVALLVAFGELAVGLGTLVGLFGRVAATGGALLSLSFFLTVSFHDSPYYYGADIVFLFAWTPFLLGGSGEFSLDAVLARVGTSAARVGDSAIDRRTALRRTSVAAGSELSPSRSGPWTTCSARISRSPPPQPVQPPRPRAPPPPTLRLLDPPRAPLRPLHLREPKSDSPRRSQSAGCSHSPIRPRAYRPTASTRAPATSLRSPRSVLMLAAPSASTSQLPDSSAPATGRSTTLRRAP